MVTARSVPVRTGSDRQLDAEDLADGALRLGLLGRVEVLGDGPVQRRGPAVLHALELREEVGVEDLVEQAGLAGAVLGPPGGVLGGVEVDGRAEVAEAAAGAAAWRTISPGALRAAARRPPAGACRPR